MRIDGTYPCAALVGLAAVALALPLATLAGYGGVFAAPFGDLPTNLIGHLAFQAPGWHWPLLQAPDLAWPNGQSIAMTDSNPLVSILAKLLASLRGKPANLLGLWLAACMILQPVAAVYALRGMTPAGGRNRHCAAITVSVLSLLMPELLFRVIHINLLGQFTLLAALGLAARGVARRRAVPFAQAAALLAMTVLIHPYLFMFCVITLTAPLIQIGASGGARDGARHLGLAMLLAAGMFVLLNGDTGGGGPGFGLYSMDVLGPVWPQLSGWFGAALPVLDATGFQHEGFNYLGAGVIAVLLLAAGSAVARGELRAAWRGWRGLILAMLALTALAVTPHVTAGGDVILPFDCAWLARPFAVLRASGRAFWVVGYALMLAGTAYLAQRLTPLRYALAMAVAVGLQWVDTAPLRRQAAAYMAGAGQTPSTLQLPADLTLFRTVPVCDPDAVTADTYRLLALRQGAHLADARLAHDPPEPVCIAMRQAGMTAPLAPGEVRLFLPSVAHTVQPAALGSETNCTDTQAGRLCYRPRSILGSSRIPGAPGR